MNELSTPVGAGSDNSDAVLVEFFDPPMCCSTGLCGPTLDQALLDANEMVSTLTEEGYRVERYQMRTHAPAFLKNPEIMRLVREQGVAALPITVVDGRIIKASSYPTMAEVKAALGALA